MFEPQEYHERRVKLTNSQTRTMLKVEAQLGKKISEADANVLIAKAQAIIEELSGGT